MTKTNRIVLTEEQKQVVDFPNDTLLIKGVAGSGKSLVLLQRALKALTKNNSERILIVTFTNTLVEYFKQQFEHATAAHKVSSEHVDILTMDSIVWEAWKSRHGNCGLLKEAFEEKVVLEAMQKHRDTHDLTRVHSLSPDFILEEFKWIRGCNLQTQDAYMNSTRTGRGSSVKVFMTDRPVIWEMYQLYVSKLTTSRHLSREHKCSMLLEDEQFLTANAYDHVFVDEAQDLPFVCLALLRKLASKSLTIAADQAQKIYGFSFSWKDMGIDVRGKSKRLKKSFRNSKQICCFAESLMESNRALQSDNEIVKADLPEAEGPLPKVVACSSQALEEEFLLQQIRSYIEHGEEVAILYFSYIQGNAIKHLLKRNSIEYDEVKKNSNWSIDSKVKLCTIHSSKGLEFDAVIIPFFNDEVFPSPKTVKDITDKVMLQELLIGERNILYVAITRAKYDLTLSYTGTPSRFLKNFDSTLYRYIDTNNKSLDKPAYVIEQKITSTQADDIGISNAEFDF